MICNHLEHVWEVEELSGASKYNGYSVIKLRCSICNAHITGEVIT